MTELVTFEEHSSTLGEWKRRGVSSRTVIYLDAHLDMQHIDDDKIQRLAVAPDMGSFLSLERPIFLDESSHYCYGLENYLYAAVRLGMIDRIVWVYPFEDFVLANRILSHVRSFLGPDKAKLYEKKCRDVVLPGVTTGEFDLLVCPLDCLNEVETNTTFLLDIDLDYFVDVSEARILINPLDALTVIKAAGEAAEFTTLSLSITSGFLPRAYLFLADYLQELLGRPALEPIEFYEVLIAADEQKANQDFEQALKLCRTAQRLRPGAGAPYALSAEVHKLEGDSGHAAESYRLAHSIDPRFFDSDIERAYSLLNRPVRFCRDEIDALRDKLTHQPTNHDASFTHLTLGLLYLRLGELDSAVVEYNQCVGAGREFPRLSGGIGTLYAKRKDGQNAQHFLSRAINFEPPTYRKARFLHHRSVISFDSGRFEDAKRDLLGAVAVDPTAEESWRYLALSYKKLNERQNYQYASRQYALVKSQSNATGACHP